MPIVDVTAQMKIGWADEELAPVRKCACGATWSQLTWGPFVLGYGPDGVRVCPECGRRFYGPAR